VEVMRPRLTRPASVPLTAADRQAGGLSVEITETVIFRGALVGFLCCDENRYIVTTIHDLTVPDLLAS